MKKVIWNLSRNKESYNYWYTVFVICSFCEKDFEVLNCHSWRCKEKLKHQRNESNQGNNSVSNNFHTVNLDCNEIVNKDCHKYVCGKKCKGLRGLKVHQRSCRPITSLNNDNIVIDNIEQDAIENHFVTTNSKQDEFLSLKEGVKLPKSPEDWRLANLCCHSKLSSINIKNILNEAMSLMNSTACNYFRDNYGYKNTIWEEEISLKERYKRFSKKDFKRN